VGERGRSMVESDLFVPEAEPAVPAISVTTAAVVELCRQLKPGLTPVRVALRIGLSSRTDGTAKNVVAVLRGSDPALRDTCVVLSAHYDHLGMKGSGEGHRVFNGANDDGTGTVSVLEIASALAAMPTPPRRSVVFVTFFGEEEGLYGSQYFARHLPCPVEKTIAGINLEQLGRPDTDRGPMPSAIALIAPSYTSIPADFTDAAEATGVSMLAKPALGDDFFSRSDNISLAEVGIPAHTAAIPAMFPDYHAVGDTWEKIDYPNMARLDRMLALGIIRLADDPDPPHWTPGIAATAGFATAFHRRSTTFPH
ncbi:MAG TPA: M28 family peptidase, partial [Bryobacteraceae bacterium]|nr:M28 family peptidase [Bryobacteraceae bacterium]